MKLRKGVYFVEKFPDMHQKVLILFVDRKTNELNDFKGILHNQLQLHFFSYEKMINNL